MNTPLSDKMISRFPEFTENVRRRLERGKQDYGDSSMRHPILRLCDEVQQEIEDICGWSLMLWSRLEDIKRKVDGLDTAQHSIKPVVPITKPLDCVGVEHGGNGKISLS